MIIGARGPLVPTGLSTEFGKALYALVEEYCARDDRDNVIDALDHEFQRLVELDHAWHAVEREHA